MYLKDSFVYFWPFQISHINLESSPPPPNNYCILNEIVFNLYIMLYDIYLLVCFCCCHYYRYPHFPLHHTLPTPTQLPPLLPSSHHHSIICVYGLCNREIYNFIMQFQSMNMVYFPIYLHIIFFINVLQFSPYFIIRYLIAFIAIVN